MVHYSLGNSHKFKNAIKSSASRDITRSNTSRGLPSRLKVVVEYCSHGEVVDHRKQPLSWRSTPLERSTLK